MVVETAKKYELIYILLGERKSVRVQSSKENGVTSVDLGINVLASLLTDECTWLLHKGFRTKGDCLYFEKRVTNIRSLADKAMEMGKAERARSVDGEEEASQEVDEEATPPPLQTRPSFGEGFLRTRVSLYVGARRYASAYSS